MQRRVVAGALIVLASVAADTRSIAQPADPGGPFDALRFRAIGPAVFAGRANDIAVVEANPSHFFVGMTTGGLWKTTDNGTTWEVLLNDRDDVVSIGAVAIAQDDPNVVWVGTGGTQSWGRGVFKSVDGGRTFEPVGLADSRHVGRIVVDRRNRDVVWVAALGHAFMPHRERGVFKTTDGGRTWQHVLFVDEDTGAFDLVLDPSNQDVAYATTWQRRRTPYGNNNGGPGSGIHKTTDGGRTWQRVEQGLPTGDRGVIGIDIFRKDPRVLYAMVQHGRRKDLFRTDDGGATWRQTNEPEDARYRGHRMNWFDQVRIDPTNADRVLVMGVNVYTSTDGGRTFSINESAVQSGLWPATSGLFIYNTSTHSDHRTFWINPSNPQHMISGNDGGVCITYEGGSTWDCMNNMDLAQYHHVGFDMDDPYRVYGGLYDNLGWGGPSATRSYLGIGAGEWFLVAGGDGFVAVADPSDSRTIYAESQNGNMSRVDRLTNERVPIRPEAPPGDEPYRWNFNTPMAISAHDSNTILMAGNRLFRSTDRGQSWRAISPDLTARIGADGLTIMGVSFDKIQIGSSSPSWGTIYTFAESPRRPGVYYTGADDGTVQVTRDGGETWTNISDRFPGLPPRTWVSKLVASQFADGRVYAAFSGHRTGDDRPYVYVSEDFGQTWRAITSGLPEVQVVQNLIEDTRNEQVLFVGTEFGLYVTIDRGGSWQRLRANLPTVPVYGLAIHPRDNDLIVGTFGRGIWILDDIAPIQEAAAALAARAHVVTPRPARQFNLMHDKWWMWGDRRYWGENPKPGAPITFYVDDPSADIRLVIRNAEGDAVRTFSREDLGPLAARRAHRVQWDLRYEPLPTPEAWRVPDGVTAFFTGAQKRAHSYREVVRADLEPTVGPFVLPGTYQVAIEVGGRVAATTRLDVGPDPLVRISDSARTTWHDLSLELHRLQGEAYAAVPRLTVLDRHRTALEATSGTARASGELEKMLDRLTVLRARLAIPVPGAPGGLPARNIANLPGWLASLKGQLKGATSPPTETQLRMMREAKDQLRAALTELDALEREAPALLERRGRAGRGQ